MTFFNHNFNKIFLVVALIATFTSSNAWAMQDGRKRRHGDGDEPVAKQQKTNTHEHPKAVDDYSQQTAAMVVDSQPTDPSIATVEHVTENPESAVCDASADNTTTDNPESAATEATGCYSGPESTESKEEVGCGHKRSHDEISQEEYQCSSDQTDDHK